MTKSFEKHLTVVLKEMCTRAGTTYGDIDFSDQNWYLSHTWTEKEQNEFRDWLVNYWYKNKEAREEMLALPWMKKKSELKKPADWFIFNYGWKIEL